MISTPNDDALKFLPGQSVSASTQTHEFTTPTSALASPLATALFGVEGVKTVFYGPDFISVTKDTDASWPTMKPEIFALIIEHFTAGRPLFKPGSTAEQDAELGPEDTRILDTDSDVVAQIKELLDTRVRPAIQEDGGDIEYRGFGETNEDGTEGDGIVRLSLKGSCRGCSSSTVTLKSGIERMLCHYIPGASCSPAVTTERAQKSRLSSRSSVRRSKSRWTSSPSSCVAAPHSSVPLTCPGSATTISRQDCRDLNCFNVLSDRLRRSLCLCVSAWCLCAQCHPWSSRNSRICVRPPDGARQVDNVALGPGSARPADSLMQASCHPSQPSRQHDRAHATGSGAREGVRCPACTVTVEHGLGQPAVESELGWLAASAQGRRERTDERDERIDRRREARASGRRACVV